MQGILSPIVHQHEWQLSPTQHCCNVWLVAAMCGYIEAKGPAGMTKFSKAAM